MYVWESANGNIPSGYEIHHKDHNKSNNEIENLELLTREEHNARHKAEMTEEQRQAKRDNLTNKARPKAAEWHKSEKGKEWHKQHYERMKDKMHILHECVCEYCGRTYMSTALGNTKFCSNVCKAAYRRKSGIDNEERECKQCGKLFITNKYSAAKYCEAHKGGQGRIRRAS